MSDTSKFIPLSALMGASLIVLAACGGGGDSGSAVTAPVAVTPPPATASSETYVTVSGAIDGFGSVIVNGVRYDTDSAAVRKNERDANLSDLSIGQIVSIRARRNGEGELPTALRVRYEEVLEGPVESIADDRRSLVILGQTVFLTDDTIFEDDLDVDAIAVDDVLEVSGSFTAEGDIVASYVEVSDDVDGDYEVHGTVGGLDTTAQTFRVKGLRIGYASAELADFDDGETLSNGDKVEVEGSVFTNDGTLIATRVEFEGDDLDELRGEEAEDSDDEEAEIEGFITSFVDATEFTVADQAVVTTGDTRFERCTADALALDVRVEVEGRYDDTGVLVASEVKCEVEANDRIEARVDAVDPEAGTISLLNVTVGTDGRTRFQDKSEARIREFGLDDIAVDDVVEVRFYDLAGQDLAVAKRIRRERVKRFDGPEVRGTLDAIEGDTLMIAGALVLTDGQTEYELDDVDVGRDAFFDAVEVGTPLKVEGVEDEDGNLLALEVERELDDDDDGSDD